MMKTNRAKAVFVMAMVLVAATGLGFGRMIGPKIGVAMATPATTGIPYVLEVEDVVTRDGVASAPIKRVFAHRADGQRSLTMFYSRPDGKSYPTRKILNPATGTLTLVHHDTQSKTTEHLPDNHLERYSKLLPDPKVECVSPIVGSYHDGPKRIVGRSRIADVDVVELRWETEQMVSREWRAPSLNCDMLRQEVDMYDDGAAKRINKIRLHSVRNVVKIQFGEPPAEFFEMPGEFPERSPIGNILECARRFKDGKVQPYVEQVFARSEQRYWSLQPQSANPNAQPAAAALADAMRANGPEAIRPLPK